MLQTTYVGISPIESAHFPFCICLGDFPVQLEIHLTSCRFPDECLSHVKLSLSWTCRYAVGKLYSTGTSIYLVLEAESSE